MELNPSVDFYFLKQKNIVFYLCFYYRNTSNEIPDKLRFCTLSYLNENVDIYEELNRLFENSVPKNFVDVIIKAYNFLKNSTIDDFSKMFPEDTHTNYIEEKYHSFKENSSHFISTRDKQNYENFMTTIENFHDKKVD